MSEATRVAGPGEDVRELEPVLPVEPPAEVLARLRAIDRRAALAYVGEDTWLLGRMMPLEEREQRARKMLAEELSLPKNIRRPLLVRVLRLYAQGFRQLGKPYTSDEVHHQKPVRDFAAAVHGITHTDDDVARERNLEASSTERMVQSGVRSITDFVQAEFRQLHRRQMRHQTITHGR